VKRGEDGVGLALPGLDRAHVDGVQPLVRAQLDAGVVERATRPLAALPRKRAHVLGHVNRRRAHLSRHLGELALRPAAANHQPRAAVAQLAVEAGEALEQELSPRPGGVAAVEQPVVEAEDRHHTVVLV
jgi:hypothetical protein